MKLRVVAVRFAVWLVLLAGPSLAAAAVAGAAAELLDRAAATVQAQGREAAFAAFNRPRGDFVDGALYVFCVDAEGVLKANGGFPGMVGMPVDKYQIGDQSKLASTMHALVASSGEAEINYQWINPDSGQIEPKRSLLRKVGSDVCGVGTYQPVARSGPPRR